MGGDFGDTPNSPSTSSQREAECVRSKLGRDDSAVQSETEAIRAHSFFPVITLLTRKCAEGMAADSADVFDIEDVIQLLRSCATKECGQLTPPASPQIDALVCTAICALRSHLDELRKVWQYAALFHQRYIQYVKRKNDAKDVVKGRSDDRKSLNNGTKNDDDNNNSDHKYNTDDNIHEPGDDVDDNSSTYDDNETSPSPNGGPDQEPTGVGIHSLTDQLWQQIVKQQKHLGQCQPKVTQTTSNSEPLPARKRRLPFAAERLIAEKSPRLDS